MGLFSKYKFKHKINKSGSLVIAKYADGGYDLLKDGRVIEKNLRMISRNVSNPQENDNKEVFFVKTHDLTYKIYDIETGDLLIDGLKPREDDFAKITKEDESIIIELDAGIWVVNERGYTISEDYANVSEKDAFGVRKVEKLNGGFDCYYYIDEKANKISPDFSLDKDAGRYKIVRCKDKDDRYRDFIWCAESGLISKGFDKIDYINGRFVVEDYGKVYFVNQLGERQTKNVSNYQILKNGTIIVKDGDNKTNYTIYGPGYAMSQMLKKVVVDEKAGIIIGDNIVGKTLMMGYKWQAVEVDPIASRLIVKRMMGKKFDERLLRDALNNNADVEKTLDVYEQIVNDNLELDKQEKILKWLSKNGRAAFIDAFNGALAMKSREAKQDPRGEKINIFFDSRITRDWQEALKKKKTDGLEEFESE